MSPSLPNLTPYLLSGWSDKIVVSRTTGTTTDSTSLTTADTLYVDWAVINNGNATASGVYVYLYVDAVYKTYWYTALLGVNNYMAPTDYSIGSLSAGTHTITITADPGGSIAESNEGDNSYTKTITVNPSPGIRIVPLTLSFSGSSAALAQFQRSSGQQAPPSAALAVEPSPDQKLIRPLQIVQGFTNGSTVKVVVGLAEPVAVLAQTDFASGKSLKALQREIKKVQQEVLGALSGNDVKVRFQFDNIAGFSAEVTPQGLSALQAHPKVVSIEPVSALHQHLAQGIPLIHGLTYRSSYNGAGMAIAICDSGIDYNHPRLGGGGFPNSKVIGGFDFGDNDSDPFPTGSPDNLAHGTCCAGIAAGDLGTVGDYIGGVAYNAKLYALKVTAADGSIDDDSIRKAWDWCVTHKNDDPSNPIMVISTSLGGPPGYLSTCDGDKPTLAASVNNAVAAGITVLVSSGNEGYCNSLGSPGCLSGVISVGGVYDAAFGVQHHCVTAEACAPNKVADATCTTYGDGGYAVNDLAAADQVPSFSNTAGFLSLLAPVNKCYTLDMTGASGYSPGDYFDDFGGTSAACPYAAGAVACLQSAAKVRTGSYLSPQEVKNRLVANGDNITDPKAGITKPRVNLERAIQSLPISGQTFRVYNDGTGTLTVNSITPETSGPWIMFAPSGPFDVVPGGYQDVTVAVDFAQAPTGQSSVRLLVASTDSSKSPYPGGVYVNVTRLVPTISVTPASQDFGSIPVGTTADRAFTVQNTGGGTLSGCAAVSSPFSVVSGSPYSLTANQSVLVTVHYSPGIAGTDNQSVSFTGAGGASRPVSGSAYNPPAIAVTPASQDFGSIQVGTTADRAFTIQNTGGGTLSGSAAVSSPFSVVSGSPYSLAANQSVLVTVRYSPGVAGTDNQSVSFTGGGGASRPVSGSAYNPPAIAVTPASQDFGSIQVGTTADQAFTVQNTGGGTLSGSASVSSPFSIVSGSPYSLTANQSVLVTVRYSPGVAGTDNQSILLTGGSGASRPVSGAAFLPTVDTPTISPNGGSYPESVQVTLACTTVGRAIFYTLDGSAPTTGSTPYGGPFTLTSSAPVKAKAFKSGYNDSATASASFTVAAAPPTQLTGMSMTSGLFRFVLNGPVGSDYVIQVSSNLVNWVPLLTNTIPVGGSLIINDPLAAGRPMRFYRAVLVNGQSVGTVVGWGDNSTGQTNLPPGLTNVVAIAAGFHHSLALKPDGTVVGWGENDFGQTNPPAGLSNVAAIAAGWGTSLALKRDGTLEEWGWDGGYGLKATAESLTNIKAIAACWDCFMALRNDNTVFVWGNSTHGETNVPAGLNNVTRIAGGGYFCMALKGDGTVVTWGSNYAGQTNVPGGLDSVAAIAAGGYHCLALKSDGTVVAWGAGTNNTGLNLAFGQSMVPPELTNAVAVSAGYYHSLALRADGTLVAWGLGSSGQTNIPAGLHGVTAISAGGYHNLALVDGSYPMQLSGVNCLPGGQVQFAVSGLAGDVYRVLGSTNLYDWQTIASLANLSGFVQFTDPGAAGRRSLFAE